MDDDNNIIEFPRQELPPEEFEWDDYVDNSLDALYYESNQTKSLIDQLQSNQQELAFELEDLSREVQGLRKIINKLIRCLPGALQS